MREERLCAGSIDAEAADGGGPAHHPQLLVAAEQAQVGHEPVAKGLPLPRGELEGRQALLCLVAEEACYLGQHAQVVLVKGPDQRVELAIPAQVKGLVRMTLRASLQPGAPVLASPVCSHFASAS